MSHPTQYWHTWKLSLMLLMTPVLFLLWHVKRINMNKGLLGHYYLTTALSDWLHHEYTIRIEDNINVPVVVLFSAASKGPQPWPRLHCCWLWHSGWQKKILNLNLFTLFYLLIFVALLLLLAWCNHWTLAGSHHWSDMTSLWSPAKPQSYRCSLVIHAGKRDMYETSYLE